MKQVKNPAQDFSLALCFFLASVVVYILVFTPENKPSSLNFSAIEEELPELKQEPEIAQTEPFDQASPVVTELEKPTLVPQDAPAPKPQSSKIEFDYEAIVDQIDSGNWREAEQILLKVIAQDPNNEHALIELAMIQILDKKIKKRPSPTWKARRKSILLTIPSLTSCWLCTRTQGRWKRALIFQIPSKKQW